MLPVMPNLDRLDACLKYQRECVAAADLIYKQVQEAHKLNEQMRADEHRPSTKEAEDRLASAVEKLDEVTKQLAIVNERVRELSGSRR